MRTTAKLLLLTLALLFPVAGSAQGEAPHWPFGHGSIRDRGRIGVQVQPMTRELREYFKAPSDRGLLVTRVEPDRPAAGGGLLVGDVIIEANGQPLSEPFDLVKVVGRVPVGEGLELRIVREKEERTLTVEPEGEATPWVDPDSWGEWIEKGVRRGREQMRQQLDDLERRLEDLERKFEEYRGLHQEGGQPT